MFRAIDRIVPSDVAMVGDGLEVLRPLPSRGLRKVGPFIFLDHFGPNRVPAGKSGKVPPHPHAGFQTVTYLLKGRGFHLDSSGGSQEILPGGVNWMTAGRGIVHAEQISGDPEDDIVEGFQIWVNLPREDKFTAPFFDGLSPDELPIRQLDGGEVRVIAGSWEDTVSPASTFSPLFLFHLKVKAGHTVEVPVSETDALGMYTVYGKAVINGEAEVARSLLATFQEGIGKIEITAREDTELMIMGGTPLKQPMASYGPFVMSTSEELQKVMADFRDGKMGEVEWQD